MCSRICRRCVKAAIVLAFGVTVVAQSLDPSALLKPSVDSWPTYHGDYTGRRHSRLTQITPANVHRLTLAWAFQTNQPQQIKATPILVNGVIYITTPDNLWAIDARSARQIWRKENQQRAKHQPRKDAYVEYQGVDKVECHRRCECEQARAPPEEQRHHQ